MSSGAAEILSLWKRGIVIMIKLVHQLFISIQFESNIFKYFFYLQTTQAPCTNEIEPCGNTCQKMLKCGNHICAERCHRSDCGQCLEVVEKKCRCGLYSKELPCSKTFLCEAKCKRMRDCNKHACNRKVC